MDSPSPERPPFVVRCNDAAVQHIRARHVNDPRERPLWAEFLGPAQDIAGALTSAIQDSQARPLYVEYDQHDEAGILLHRTREFVTRAGIVAVVRLTADDSGDVMTAYFPYETLGARPRRRWMSARESRIKQYAGQVTYGLAQTAFTPASVTDIFPSADPPGERRNVRFVNDERWGIRTAQIGDSEVRAFGHAPPWPER
jgi:hypothetical protein